MVKRLHDAAHQRLGHGLVVNVQAEVSLIDHVHPKLAVADDASLEGLAHCAAGTKQAADALVLQKVLDHVPGQLMNELKGLDNTLLLQVAQGTLRQLHGQTELVQCALVVVEALLPANVLVHDDADPRKKMSMRRRRSDLSLGSLYLTPISEIRV